MSHPEPVTILLIEDDPGHARLIQKNLTRSGISNQMLLVPDGQQAADLLFAGGLQERGLSASRILVLLDLNLPFISGYELLQRIKSTPATSMTPVVILTTTDDDREIEKCYQLGCNVYVTKPVEYEAFAEAVRTLGLLVSIVALPSSGM